MPAISKLSQELSHAYPLKLIGEQQQSIMIVKALAIRPKVLVCDDPVPALDAPMQYQVVNILVDLQQRRGMALYFIGLELILMNLFCDRLVYIDGGIVVKSGVAEEMFIQP